jgi:hypothetical protein
MRDALAYTVVFVAGFLSYHFLSRHLGRLMFRKGRYLSETLRNLNPDSFLKVRKAVDAETTRRNALLPGKETS